MASVLGAPSDGFEGIWRDTYWERGEGVFESIDANLVYICGKLGVSAEDAQIGLAAQMHMDYFRRSLRLQPGAIAALARLKSDGLKTGLITDCDCDVPQLWDEMPIAEFIDVAVFSCLVGMQKPDPRIYRLAAERLAVEPSDCLYVGDGESHELTGASQVGMRPVLVRVPGADSSDLFRVNYEAEEWDGLVVWSLAEIADLVW